MCAKSDPDTISYDTESIVEFAGVTLYDNYLDSPTFIVISDIVTEVGSTLLSTHSKKHTNSLTD